MRLWLHQRLRRRRFLPRSFVLSTPSMLRRKEGPELHAVGRLHAAHGCSDQFAGRSAFGLKMPVINPLWYGQVSKAACCDIARISEPALPVSSRKKPSLPFAPRKVMSLAPMRMLVSGSSSHISPCFMYGWRFSSQTPTAVMNCKVSAPCIFTLLSPMELFHRVLLMVPSTRSLNTIG